MDFQRTLFNFSYIEIQNEYFEHFNKMFHILGLIRSFSIKSADFFKISFKLQNFLAYKNYILMITSDYDHFILIR